MAQPVTQNPYAITIGNQVQIGLNSIITNIGTVTIANLQAAIYGYIQPLYYPASPSAQISDELQSVDYHVINSLRNNLVLSGCALYDASQMQFIDLLIGNSMFPDFTSNMFTDRVSDIEDNIGDSYLNISQQTPLFLATTCGSNAYTYWAAAISNSSGNWYSKFSTVPGQSYSDSIRWAVGAMNGALVGYGAMAEGLIDPTTSIVSVRMVSALIGALTLTAGMVLFNWIPRITKPMNGPLSIVQQRNQTASCCNSTTYKAPYMQKA